MTWVLSFLSKLILHYSFLMLCQKQPVLKTRCKIQYNMLNLFCIVYILVALVDSTTAAVKDTRGQCSQLKTTVTEFKNYACDDLNRFQVKQCIHVGLSHNCTCVNPMTGLKLHQGYSASMPTEVATMTCDCALEKYYHPGSRAVCSDNGNYAGYRCWNDPDNNGFVTSRCGHFGVLWTKVQCRSASSCICVDPNTGRPLLNLAFQLYKGPQAGMTCECAYKRRYRHIPLSIKCRPNGNFGCDSKTQFMCQSETKCIKLSQRCNHVKDCKDGSDELNCTLISKKCSDAVDNNKYITPLCDPSGVFWTKVQCLSKSSCVCIDPKSGRQLLNPHAMFQPYKGPQEGMTCECAYKRQYHHMPLSEKCAPNGNMGCSEFMCVSKKACIPLSRKCDGNFDCPDRSDETSCSSIGCNTTTQFRCWSGQKCINLSQQCNNYKDCPDGSDEEYCSLTKCQRVQKTFTWYRCDNSGKFQLRQCIDNRCQCVDPLTGQQIGSYRFNVSLTSQILNIDCFCAYDESMNKKVTFHSCLSNGNYKDDGVSCRDAQTIAKRIRADVPSKYVPTCSADGLFTMVQCDDTWCWCVHHLTGNFLNSFVQKGTPAHQNMNCKCARDRTTWKSNEICLNNGNYYVKCGEKQKQERRTTCETNYNDAQFSSVQCSDVGCHCFDKLGNQLGNFKAHYEGKPDAWLYMNCACARQPQHKWTACAPNGNFKCVPKIGGLGCHRDGYRYNIGS